MKSYWTFCCCSVTKSCLTFYDPTDCCSRLGSSVLYCLPEFAQTNVCWVSDAIQLTHPPFSPCLQFFPASGSFPVSALPIRWPKYWSFTFSISLANEYSGLISFRINWFDLLAVQGTLKSLLQHHNTIASILQTSLCPVFTFVHDYWKNHGFDYTHLCQQSDVSAFQYAV